MPTTELGPEEPLQIAFSGIARILFAARLLTSEILEKQLRLFVVEAAFAGDWIPAPRDSKRAEIFSGYLGHRKAWQQFNERYGGIFLAEIAEWQSALLEVSIPVVATADSVGSQLNRLKDECHLTAEELAEKIDIDPRSVQRHLAGTSVPHARHLRAYEKEFSKLLNRKVVVNKTS